jgi:hypothetical protein
MLMLSRGATSSRKLSKLLDRLVCAVMADGAARRLRVRSIQRADMSQRIADLERV